jgi:hypothetical protein
VFVWESLRMGLRSGEWKDFPVRRCKGLRRHLLWLSNDRASWACRPRLPRFKDSHLTV